MNSFVRQALDKKMNSRNVITRIERLEKRSRGKTSVFIQSLDQVSPELGTTYLTENGYRADGIIFAENINQIQQGDNTSHLRTISVPFTGGFLAGHNSVIVTVTGVVWNNSGASQTIECDLRLQNDDASIDYQINNGTGFTVVNSSNQKGYTITFVISIAPTGGLKVVCNETYSIESAYPAHRRTETTLSTAAALDDITQIVFSASATGTTSLSFIMDNLTICAVEGQSVGGEYAAWSRTGDDTVIQGDNPTTNYGTAATVAVGERNDASGATRRTLIKPDGLTNIPSGATITKAALMLTVAGDYASNANTYYMCQLLRNWTEAGATWNTYDGTTPWTTAGMGLTDYEVAGASTNVSVGTSEAVNSVILWEFGSGLLQYLNNVLSGADEWYGFCIIGNTENNDAYTFHSYEATTEEFRPVFYVEYQV